MNFVPYVTDPVISKATLLGPFELVLLIVLALLLFGGSRISQLGSSLGKSIRDFKREMNRPDENAQIDVTPKAGMKEIAPESEGKPVEKKS